MNKDFAIITALQKELSGFLTYIDPDRKREKKHVGNRTYYELTTQNGLQLVCASASGMGQTQAVVLARDVMEQYHPDKIILVGIAGGLDRNIRLGDIVVSDQIVDYELAKEKPGETDYRWEIYRSDPSLLNKFQNYHATAWLDRIQAVSPVGTFRPKVYPGMYLSGNKVIADETKAGNLRDMWHKAKAIEMEGAGVAAAVYHSIDQPGFIMLKAICDYADPNKNDEWQEYAAHAAGAYLAAFILDEFSGQTANNKPTMEDLEAIRHQVRNAKLRNALEMLLALPAVQQDHDLKTDVSAIISNYKSVERQERIGIISSSNANIEKSKVTLAILQTLTDLERNA